MRADARKNTKKVAGAVLKRPDATQQEIADEIGIGKGTVSRSLVKLKQIGTLDRTVDTIQIAGTDIEIVQGIQKVIMRILPYFHIRAIIGDIGPGSLNALSQVAERSQRRQAFLDGENSNAGGGERNNELRKMTDDQLLKLLQNVTNNS